jgi:predicted RNA-binding Zn-ribbon protein involved in translation (DUF1610 family)
MTMLADDQVRVALTNNRCPDCGNYGLTPGPRGGAGRNLFCANPGCRAGFNVAPLDEPAFIQRIDKGRDCYYPPRMHLLGDHGPLCAFLFAQPSEWPIGHAWTRTPAQATCPDCGREFERRWNNRHGR